MDPYEQYMKKVGRLEVCLLGTLENEILPRLNGMDNLNCEAGDDGMSNVGKEEPMGFLCSCSRQRPPPPSCVAQPEREKPHAAVVKVGSE